MEEKCTWCREQITGYKYSMNAGVFCDNCWKLGYALQENKLFRDELAEKYQFDHS